MSLLPVVLACDAVATSDPDYASQTPFFLSSSSPSRIGALLPQVVSAVADSPDGPLEVSPSREKVYFKADFDTPDKRTRAMEAMVERWRAQGMFSDPLKGWRNERYSIYGDVNEAEGSIVPGAYAQNVAFDLERAACGLFGVSSFGVHMSGWIPPSTLDQEMRLWVPRRSATKQTYPSLLDQTVAGGLTAGLDPRTCVVKECSEEASIPEALVLAPGKLKATGIVTYMTRAGVWIQPEVQYCFDLEMPEPSVFTPTPGDGEAESFELVPVSRIIELLHAGDFKPNCALVMVDFLVRHGLISSETDPHYQEITRRLHRDLGLPGIIGRTDR